MPMGSWKVGWIGDVDFHSRARTPSQPSLSVVMVGVGDRNLGQVTEVFLPVAQLFPLALGRIWTDKVRTSQVEPGVVERKIEFASSLAIECPAGIPLKGHFGGEFLLPFNGYRHHQTHTKGSVAISVA